MPRPQGRKYQPLADYLAAQTADEVALSFSEIRAILKRPLSATAYLPEWWTGNSVHRRKAQRWQAAGWEATAFASRDDDRWVTFRRRPADAGS